MVGPIVWHLPEDGASNPNRLKLTVFDVPAVSDLVMRDLNGEDSNYLHPDHLRRFVDDIVALGPEIERVFGRPVDLCLKMKRGYHAQYAKAYFDHVDSLAASGTVSLTGQQDNLYRLISSSDLVIAYPFTSPAYIAEKCGVPAVFYDPTESVVRRDFSDSDTGIYFASGRVELWRVAIHALSLKLAPVSGAAGPVCHQ